MTLAVAKAKLAYHIKRRARADRKYKKAAQTKPGSRSVKHWLLERNRQDTIIRPLRKQVAAHKPLRLKALSEARKLVGVMEVGGNNQGKVVTQIIRANKGAGPEPWCGDFVAYAYRKAGSKAVQRGWASVSLIGRLAGMGRTSSPQAGDLVVFNFDHVGMFVKDLGGGFIETIEGNTGASGAVSDSKTGGDGVYVKKRSKALVARYVRVLR